METVDFGNKPPKITGSDYLLMAAIAILFSIAIYWLVSPSMAYADDWRLERIIAPQESVPNLISQAAASYNLSAPRMTRIAWCESQFDPKAVNKKSGASGVFQFIWSTWAWASPRAGYPGYSVFHPKANIFTAAWLAKNVGFHQWSCR